MKLLIAEDDDFFQRILHQVLGSAYDIISAYDGDDAWTVLHEPDAPRLAILDWVMPGLSGPQVCRRVRACPDLASMYLIILTSKNNEADIVSGLRAGADDYITKPPLPAELLARVRVGERVLELQAALEEQSAVAKRTFRATTQTRVPKPQGRSLDSCTQQPEPEDCCSVHNEKADPFRPGFLTLSQGNRYPHR